jgi:hypothetical protein
MRHVVRIVEMRCVYILVGREGVVWINLAEDRDRWQVLLNIVMNL